MTDIVPLYKRKQADLRIETFLVLLRGVRVLDNDQHSLYQREIKFCKTFYL